MDRLVSIKRMEKSKTRHFNSQPQKTTNTCEGEKHTQKLFNWFAHFSFLFPRFIFFVVYNCNMRWIQNIMKKKADKRSDSPVHISWANSTKRWLICKHSSWERIERSGRRETGRRGSQPEFHVGLEFPQPRARARSARRKNFSESTKSWRQRNYNKESVNFSCRQINFHSKMITMNSSWRGKEPGKHSAAELGPNLFPLIPQIPSAWSFKTFFLLLKRIKPSHSIF